MTNVKHYWEKLGGANTQLGLVPIILLAVIKRMTESLGGTVSFESEEGKGTKFIVELPV